ncbi:uncharacterized protein LOC126830271 [Patella vulgata]|uniref:uncharacterized protein LOC126830271 n=1 Tax=Patella vulgata TaxID=6465 RepID=UPI00217FC43D|nr:uncharacterized protein LOC126830271 [Patella vulgata]
MATMLMLVKSSFVVFMVMNSVMMVLCLVEKQLGCYHPTDSSCSIHTLTCPEDRRLSIYSLYYYTHPSTTTCPLEQDECETSPCCTWSNGDTLQPYNDQDSLDVYKTCSIQQSCSITSPYNHTTGYHYVEYGYECEPEYYIHDIMTTERISFRGGHFSLYYSGKDSPAKGLTCSCVLPKGDFTLKMQLLYIYLSGESCTRVTVTGDDTPEYTCNDDGVFISKQNNVHINDIYRITFNNLTSSNDDVIWIEFTGRPENASCDCKAQFEVRNGSWSNWSLYSACSVTCGGCNKTRTRKCNNPTPANGGTKCSGKTMMYSRCNEQLCPGL